MADIIQFPQPTLQILDPAARPNSFEQMILSVSAECIAIMIERQKKYGPFNISKHGESGVMIRLDDKIARLQNSSDDMDDETRDDTWIDIANYAMIALCVRKGWWDKDGCPPLLPEA